MQLDTQDRLLILTVPVDPIYVKPYRDDRFDAITCSSREPLIKYSV